MKDYKGIMKRQKKLMGTRRLIEILTARYLWVVCTKLLPHCELDVDVSVLDLRSPRTRFSTIKNPLSSHNVDAIDGSNTQAD